MQKFRWSQGYSLERSVISHFVEIKERCRLKPVEVKQQRKLVFYPPSLRWQTDQTNRKIGRGWAWRPILKHVKLFFKSSDMKSKKFPRCKYNSGYFQPLKLLLFLTPGSLDVLHFVGLFWVIQLLSTLTAFIFCLKVSPLGPKQSF